MKPEDYVHRIGRTGRAGRDGLAVTLAERNDAGMIRRIQQFTTQQIPVGTIAGLEPTGPQPRLFPQRPGTGHAPAPASRGPRHESRRPPENRPQFAGRDEPRRNPFDRALPNRDERRAPAARPGPAAFKGRPKPQRSRPGGYAR
jgi:superfamily II DNA/RNA helicase